MPGQTRRRPGKSSSGGSSSRGAGRKRRRRERQETRKSRSPTPRIRTRAAASPPEVAQADPPQGPPVGEEASARTAAAAPKSEHGIRVRASIGDLATLQKQIEEERSRLHFFVLKAKQEHEDKLETLEKQERREREYYQACLGDTCGPGQRFVVEDELGKGVFSTVYRCRDTVSEGQYAIKFIRANAMLRRAAEKEVRLMGRLCKEAAGHDPEGARCLLGLAFFECFEHEGHLSLVFELMKCDLRTGLSKYGQGHGLPLLPTVRNFGRNIFLGLRALRRIGIIHCDVKPENLLLSLDKSSVKLSDFGSAMDMAERIRTDYMQPRFYRAPEVILGQSYSTQIDVWSAGVTLCELATGRCLFSGASNNEMIHEMLQVCGAFPRRFAVRGEFAAKHFNSNGDFLNANGDFSVNSTNPPVIPMAALSKPARPILQQLEADLKEPPRGVDAGRHRGLVRHLADLVEKCLVPDPAGRPTPELALGHRFFEKGA